MNKTRPCQCILGPADHPGINELANTLDAIGFRSSVLRDLGSAAASHADGPLIALLVDDESFSTELMRFIDHWRPPRMLGLVESNIDSRTSPVIEHCADLAFLPCSEQELGFRLAQITGDQRMPEPTDSAETAPAEFLAMNLIGQSPAFLRVLDAIKRVAQSDVTVSIYGETGTGKELAARAVHYLGNRQAGPFIPINCGSLPDTLLENELFGHERGAFTDAKNSQPGLIEQADGGTLFLDEVEDISAKAQVALLRFLQEGEYRPLGSRTLKTANVRVVAASNVPFMKLKETGRLRSDLFYRLNVLPIFVPPLRERGDDILLMAEHFLTLFRILYQKPGVYLHPSSQRWISRHDWPGNIRELENSLHRGFLMAHGNAIYPHAMLPQCEAGGPWPVLPETPDALPFGIAKAAAVNAFEKDYLTNLLEHSGGNITRAAKQANKERRALGKLLKKHGL